MTNEERAAKISERKIPDYNLGNNSNEETTPILDSGSTAGMTIKSSGRSRDPAGRQTPRDDFI